MGGNQIILDKGRQVSTIEHIIVGRIFIISSITVSRSMAERSILMILVLMMQYQSSPDSYSSVLLKNLKLNLLLLVAEVDFYRQHQMLLAQILVKIKLLYSILVNLYRVTPLTEYAALKQSLMEHGQPYVTVR